MNFVWPLLPALIGTAFLALFYRRYRAVPGVAFDRASLRERMVERLREREEELAERKAQLKKLEEDNQVRFQELREVLKSKHQAFSRELTEEITRIVDPAQNPERLISGASRKRPTITRPQSWRF